MAAISKSYWEKKKEILMNLGWSEDEFYFAFKRQPIFVLTSGKKIKILMDFFVEKLGLKPLDIVSRPNLLLVSLEGRIIPRCGCETGYDMILLIRWIYMYMIYEPEKNLKPKIEYFQSLGVSGSDLPALLSSTKSVLTSSLKNNIMPFIDFLKGFLQTDENLTSALLKVSPVIGYNMEKAMMPNINTLRARGVPEPHIRRLILLSPRSLFSRIDLFEKMVDEIKKIGFEPTSKLFLLAIRSMTKLSKSKWENKKEILMNFGWSEDEFYSAFKRQSMFVLTSVKKIGILMNFFMEKLGLKPSEFVRRPKLFSVSFERRIIPRWSVIKVLKSKKLLEMHVDVGLSLSVSSMDFKKKFVIPYIDKTPEVMKA
ncbi:hypothetical protein QYF36_020243 [Acer negundo]|nr:hypothetical protein QYF36_020243 [Acer negundo]